MSTDSDMQLGTSPGTTTTTNRVPEIGTFFSNILSPGSSLHPTFLAIVDGAFLFLALVLLMLAFLTSGSLHIFTLIFIELGLWVSVKWFVNELKKMPKEEAGTRTVYETEAEQKKDQ